MRIVDREHDAISLNPNLDRTAFWMTIHAPTSRQNNRVLHLTPEEARKLADALLLHAEELERQPRHSPVSRSATEWGFSRTAA
jgi:hypothetical protein